MTDIQPGRATPMPPMIGEGNDMEKAVLRHLQLQTDLERAQHTIEKMRREADSNTRTIVRLSDQIDGMRIDISALTDQRNLFMREAVELACHIDGIVEMASTNADALRRAGTRAKEIAKFKAVGVVSIEENAALPPQPRPTIPVTIIGGEQEKDIQPANHAVEPARGGDNRLPAPTLMS